MGTRSSGIVMVLLKATTHIDSINIFTLSSVIHELALGLSASTRREAFVDICRGMRISFSALSEALKEMFIL